MQHSSIWTTADDRGVRRSCSTVATKDLFDQRLDFVLLHARSHCLHRFAVSFGGDVGRGLHDLQLFGTLQHTHLVNDRRRIDDRLRWVDRLAIQRSHARDLLDDRIVELLVHPETVVKDVCAIEKVSQLRLKLYDRKSIFSPKLTLRAVDTGSASIPNLSFRISWTHKQRVLLVSFELDDRECVRFFKTSQVEKVRVLTKTIMRVV